MLILVLDCIEIPDHDFVKLLSFLCSLLTDAYSDMGFLILLSVFANNLVMVVIGCEYSVNWT